MPLLSVILPSLSAQQRRESKGKLNSGEDEGWYGACRNLLVSSSLILGHDLQYHGAALHGDQGHIGQDITLDIRHGNRVKLARLLDRSQQQASHKRALAGATAGTRRSLDKSAVARQKLRPIHT